MGQSSWTLPIVHRQSRCQIVKICSSALARAPRKSPSCVNLDLTYKNPADSGSEQGVKITLDKTAYWNGQKMRRTELAPNRGYQCWQVVLSLQYAEARGECPKRFRECQIASFESHFTEMKSEWIGGESATSNPALQWIVNDQSN
jgi:hypothetical protein